MGFIAINAAEITCEIEIAGNAGPANVVFGVDGSTLLSAVNIQAALDAVLTNTPGFPQLFATTQTLTNVTTRFRSSPTTVEIAGNVLNTPGVRSGSLCPPNTAVLVRKVTGLAGRINRGRMYLPPPVETVVGNDGLLNPSEVTNYQNGADQFLADLAASSIPMVILHTDPAITPTAVQDLVVENKVATQRRRLR